MFYIQLFGTVTIEQDGQRLRKLGSQKSIAMLAYLISRRQAVSRVQLADLLWGEKSEAKGRNNVRWSLNNLSKLLPDCFINERETIQFEAPPDTTADLLMFDTLRNKGDFDSLALALEHYRGDFMDGFFLDDCPDFEQWILQERGARQQQVIQVMEKLIAYYIRFNQFYHVFQLISDILEIEPWREDIHRQMMYYLALKGKRSNALKHFDICCDILETELQVSPELETVRLYECIRDGGDLTPYNQYPDLEETASIILTKTTSPRRRIPVSATPFIGRADELDTLCQMICDGCRLLTLTGQGGIGKTRLAIEMGNRLSKEFNDQVYFIRLASITNSGEIPLAIAEGVGYNFTGGRDITQQLTNFFADKYILLIIDNLEHVIDGATLLHMLVTQVPDLHIIVSSRIRTNLLGEYVYEVKELACPQDGIQQQHEVASVTLFQSHMNRIIPDHVLSNEDRIAINKICELTRGVPLAIELAASWLNSLTVSDIADELQHSIDFLLQNRSDIPTHHQSIRATFDYTWNLLSDFEQVTFAKLAIFKGGCTRDAARHITETNFQALASLIDKSILRHDTHSRRYTMHELHYQFVTEKLHIICDVYALQKRHAHYYANMLHQHHDALYSTNLPDAIDTITAEISNIRQAWDWALQHKIWSIIDETLHPLGRYYRVVGLFEDRESVFRSTLKYLTESDMIKNSHKLLIARVHQEYSMALVDLGKTEEAITSSQELLQMANHLNQMPLKIAGYLNWGKALWNTGDVKSARNYLEQAMELADTNPSLSTHYLRLENIRMMGMVALRNGDFQNARRYFDQCLNDDLGDIYSQGQILRNLGSIYRNLGDYDLAKEYYTKALHIHRQIGNPHGESTALNGLGDIEFYQFRYSKALSNYQQSLKLTQKIGDKRGEGVTLNNIGSVLQILGDYDNAGNYFKRAIEAKEKVGFHRGIAWSQCCISLMNHQRGNHTDACDLCKVAYDAFVTLGDSLGQCFASLYWGHAALALGQVDEAEAKYQMVISKWESFDQPHLLMEAKAGLARTLLQKKQTSEALIVVNSIVEFLEQHGQFYGTYEPFRIYLTCIMVLQSAEDARADELLNQVKTLLQQLAEQITKPSLKESFLMNVSVHSELLNL